MQKEEKIIIEIKNKILNLGLMHPGSISKQFNVCGKEGCKCKNTENPQKHGPYYQLSYSIKGKSSSVFIKEKDLVEAKKRIKNYKKFKELNIELTKATVNLSKKIGFSTNVK